VVELTKYIHILIYCLLDTKRGLRQVMVRHDKCSCIRRDCLAQLNLEIQEGTSIFFPCKMGNRILKETKGCGMFIILYKTTKLCLH